MRQCELWYSWQDIVIYCDILWYIVIYIYIVQLILNLKNVYRSPPPSAPAHCVCFLPCSEKKRPFSSICRIPPPSDTERVLLTTPGWRLMPDPNGTRLMTIGGDVMAVQSLLGRFAFIYGTTYVGFGNPPPPAEGAYCKYRKIEKSETYVRKRLFSHTKVVIPKDF